MSLRSSRAARAEPRAQKPRPSLDCQALVPPSSSRRVLALRFRARSTRKRRGGGIHPGLAPQRVRCARWSSDSSHSGSRVPGARQGLNRRCWPIRALWVPRFWKWPRVPSLRARTGIPWSLSPEHGAGRPSRSGAEEQRRRSTPPRIGKLPRRAPQENRGPRSAPGDFRFGSSAESRDPRQAAGQRASILQLAYRGGRYARCRFVCRESL